MAEVQAWIIDSEPQGGHGEARIYLQTPFRLKDKCKGLPGARWNPDRKAWHVPATVASAHAIARALRGESIEMDEAVRRLVESSHRQISAQSLKDATDLPQPPVRTEAWLHQRRAFAFASELDATMLAMDMGTGKSLVTIALLQHFDVRKVLILCPANVVGVWPAQFIDHALDPDEWVIAAPKPGKMPIRSRTEQVYGGVQRAQLAGKRLAAVVNFEASWREPMSLLLKSVEWDEIILDESHRVKSAGGRQSKFATTLRRQSRRRGCNTGTPMPHSPLDVYAQYRFLDPGIFGTSKNRFLNRYALQETHQRRDGRSYDSIEGWQNMDEFTEKFRSIAFVVSKDDALPDLPTKMPPMERTFGLGPKALRLYVNMAKEMIAEVEDLGYTVAANSLSKIMRLRQITSGHAKLDTGETIPIDDGREKLLADVLEDLPAHEPVVVFCVFKPDLAAIRRVCEQMGRRYGELSGATKGGLTDDAKMRPDIDVLGCQLKSGGVGIDLSRAAYAIYYSVGYELGDYEQSTDRLHRPGQTRPVNYIHLVAENAEIDRVMYRAMRDKRDVVQAILDAAKEKVL